MQDLRDQVASKTDNDDQILSAVNVKVEEWKVVISPTEWRPGVRRTLGKWVG